MFGFFQLVYFTNRSVIDFKKSAAPDFLCFNSHKCPALLNTIVNVELMDDRTCFHTSHLIDGPGYLDFDQLLSIFEDLGQKCQRASTEKSCGNSSYFYCNRSLKCIPYHRVGDGMRDCYFFEDELFNACHLNDSNRFICPSDTNKCLLPVAIGNGIPQCPLEEDQLFVYTRDLAKLIPFSVLCDIGEHYHMQSITATETDETNCQWWPCNNPYTRCDDIWHCPNGADELNCPNSQCQTNEHECLNSWNGLLYCIPMAHLYDKYLDDCNDSYLYRQLYFYNETNDISEEYLSWNVSKCIISYDICHIYHKLSISIAQTDICSYMSNDQKLMLRSNVQLLDSNESLCYLDFRQNMISVNTRYFTPVRLGDFPSIISNSSFPIIPDQAQNKKVLPNIDQSLLTYCHRGIAILTAPNNTITCLCPPNYFGNQCQWQNQRISLTLQFHSSMTISSTVIFQVIIMLIDENYGNLTSIHEQIIYIRSRDCDTKYNIYLLYPHRPKNLSHRNYSIRIDLYDKTKLEYWSSWYLSIPFAFLTSE